METQKQLRKPENWQDFESLCKKLWGEIWNCREIKKNGRHGQSQRGVDIYGIPQNEREYYGIQCKAKDEYTHKRLTQNEIVGEINDEKKFIPPLKKLYIATTANRVCQSKSLSELRTWNIENLDCLRCISFPGKTSLS